MNKRAQAKPHFRVDLHLHSNPKMLVLPAPEFKLYFLVMSWCAEQRTDGLIPRAQIESMVRAQQLPPGTIKGLLDREFLANGKPEDVYELHDYLDWQNSRREIEAYVRKKQQAGRKGGKKAASKRQASATAGATADA